MHERVGTAALAEEYVEGRELSVGVLGNERLATFPVWEVLFKKLPEGSAEAAEMKKRMSRIELDVGKQKQQFLELNSPQFPKTLYTLYGSACNDRRWMTKAKVILVEKP